MSAYSLVKRQLMVLNLGQMNGGCWLGVDVHQHGFVRMILKTPLLVVEAEAEGEEMYAG